MSHWRFRVTRANDFGSCVPTLTELRECLAGFDERELSAIRCGGMPMPTVDMYWIGVEMEVRA